MNEQIKKLQLGIEKELVLLILGEPVESTTKGAYDVLQFSAKAPSLADFLYFEGEFLVMKELSLDKDETLLSDIFSQNGESEFYYELFEDEYKDSYNSNVFVWPEKGVDVFVSGHDANGKVMIQREFSPMTLEKYEASFGKLWAQRKNTIIEFEVNSEKSNLSLTKEEVNTIKKVIEMPQQVRTNNQVTIYALFAGVVFIVILLVVIIMKKKKKKKPKVQEDYSTPPQSPIV